LRRIHGGCAFDRGNAQSVHGCEAPRLVCALGCCRHADRLECPRSARVQYDDPATRTHLYAQPAVRLETRRQRRLQAHGNKAGRQQRTQVCLTRLPGNLQRQPRLQLAWNRVGQLTVHANLESVGLGRRGRRLCPEPNRAVAELGVADRLPGHDQRDDSRSGGHRQGIRQARPRHVAGNGVGAITLQPEHRPSVARNDWCNAAIHPHILWPVRKVAWQRDPAGRERMNVLLETGPGRSGIDAQRTDPVAHAATRLTGVHAAHVRAAQKLRALQGPALPRAQFWWNRLGRAALRHYRARVTEARQARDGDEQRH
jgi:hypothetical protein